MKNFYELSTEEKSKFRSEFNKLKFTKDVNAVRGPSLFAAILCLILSGILAGIAEDGVKIHAWVDFVETIGVLSLGLFTILEVYINIAFKRWMKIKHDVKY